MRNSREAQGNENSLLVPAIGPWAGGSRAKRDIRDKKAPRLVEGRLEPAATLSPFIWRAKLVPQLELAYWIRLRIWGLGVRLLSGAPTFQ
jgi:hypothetical protein